MSFTGWFGPAAEPPATNSRSSHEPTLACGWLSFQINRRLFRPGLAVGGRYALVCRARTATGGTEAADTLLAAAKSGSAALAAQGGDYAFAMLDEELKSLTLGLAPLSELQLTIAMSKAERSISAPNCGPLFERDGPASIFKHWPKSIRSRSFSAKRRSPTRASVSLRLARSCGSTRPANRPRGSGTFPSRDRSASASPRRQTSFALPSTKPSPTDLQRSWVR